MHSHGDRGNEEKPPIPIEEEWGMWMNELYELPDGWEWKTINDVCDKITDGAHKSPKTIEKGRPYITVRDIDNNGNIDFINCKKISEEDERKVSERWGVKINEKYDKQKYRKYFSICRNRG